MKPRTKTSSTSIYTYYVFEVKTCLGEPSTLFCSYWMRLIVSWNTRLCNASSGKVGSSGLRERDVVNATPLNSLGERYMWEYDALPAINTTE